MAHMTTTVMAWHRSALTAITATLHTPALRTAITVRTGLLEASSSAPVLGSAAASMDVDSTVADFTAEASMAGAVTIAVVATTAGPFTADTEFMAGARLVIRAASSAVLVAVPLVDSMVEQAVGSTVAVATVVAGTGKID